MEFHVGPLGLAGKRHTTGRRAIVRRPLRLRRARQRAGRYDRLVHRARSSDTSPEVERVQLELLRRAGEARRFQLMRSLTSTVVDASRRALSETMPGASEQEVLLRWVEIHYGQALADGVRRRLERPR